VLLSGNDLTVGKPGEIRNFTKALARRAFNGGQGSDVVKCWGERSFSWVDH
jgi:hypothetical protein